MEDGARRLCVSVGELDERKFRFHQIMSCRKLFEACVCMCLYSNQTFLLLFPAVKVVNLCLLNFDFLRF